MSGKVKQSRAAIQREYKRKRDADPSRRAEYLLKEKTKYVRNVNEGKKKLIKSMTERTKRQR